MLQRKKAAAFVLGTLVVSGTITSCNLSTATLGKKIPADKFGLLVNLYGEGEKGISNAELITDGRIPYNSVNQALELFDKSIQTYRFSDSPDVESEVPEAISFSLGGILVTEDVRLAARIPFDDGGQSAKAFLTTHGLNTSLREVMRTLVKAELEDCFASTVSNLGIDSIEQYNQVRTTEVSEKVQSCLNAEFGDYLVISNFSLIGIPGLPPEVQEQITSAQTARQRAERAQLEAQTAKAEAEANLAKTQGEVNQQRLEAELASDPNFLAKEELEIRRMSAEANLIRAQNWNGVEPAPVIVNTPNAQVSGGTVQ